MTNELTKLFNYEGNEVTFRNHDGLVYINATQMARPFGKKPAEYLRLPSTMAFIFAITNRNKAMGKTHRLVDTVNGVGTWMHEDVAIDFAQWLSINFRLWCNERIKELLTTGTTSLMSEEEMTLRVIGNLTQKVQEQKAALQSANTKIAQIQPAVDYTTNVLKSDHVYTTTQVAAGLGMSAKKLNKKLKELGVQRETRDGMWVLKTQYMGKGYEFIETKLVPSDTQGVKTRMQMTWTETGKAFIHSKVNPVMVESFEKRTQFLTEAN